MALPVETLLSLIAFLLMVANKVHSQGSTSFHFNSFNPNPTDLIYQGDAHVPCGASENLRLTRTNSWSEPQTTSVGRVLYSRPIQLWQRSTNPRRKASFSTRVFITQRVSSGGGADGVTLFLAPVGTEMPCGRCSTGGNLGVYNASSSTPPVFAAEIDYFPNPGWDPDYPHFGININSIESRKMTRMEGLGIFITILYNATTNCIFAQTLARNGILTLTYSFDLSTILPDFVQVGVSSSTGADPSNLGVVEVTDWQFISEFEPRSVTHQNIHPQYDHLIQKQESMASSNDLCDMMHINS